MLMSYSSEHFQDMEQNVSLLRKWSVQDLWTT